MTSLILEEAKNKYIEKIIEISNEYNLDAYFLYLIFEPIFREIENNKNLLLQKQLQERKDSEE